MKERAEIVQERISGICDPYFKREGDGKKPTVLNELIWEAYQAEILLRKQERIRIVELELAFDYIEELKLFLDQLEAVIYNIYIGPDVAFDQIERRFSRLDNASKKMWADMAHIKTSIYPGRSLQLELALDRAELSLKNLMEYREN